MDAWDGWPPPRELPSPPDRVLPFLRGLNEVLSIAILAAVMLLVFQFFVANYQVDGASMNPTFEDGDRLIVNRLAYRLGDPKPGDVVVFDRANGRDLLKRVVAVGGQRLSISGGVVYRDGVPLDEPYIAAPPADYPEVLIPEGHVFLMGDNRNNSLDSRSFGAVPASSIVGRADLRYLPLGHWWLVEHVRGD